MLQGLLLLFNSADTVHSLFGGALVFERSRINICLKHVVYVSSRIIRIYKHFFDFHTLYVNTDCDFDNNYNEHL